jgi:hypothetical protein
MMLNNKNFKYVISRQMSSVQAQIKNTSQEIVSKTKAVPFLLFSKKNA